MTFHRPEALERLFFFSGFSTGFFAIAHLVTKLPFFLAAFYVSFILVVGSAVVALYLSRINK